ncbi:MAG: DUF1634 domain-containing protein [Thermoflavifilum sp.]|jgi:uncharacterized membrane protein|uniref:DUF1634 domain-containing protein n=1 Tax=Thermoflavifilum sp. TaxID=1968839 RepID=UPI0018A48B03|nr:DUF1634 domain-containing protein [Thermoflavifilum sp.]QOR76943.1 MAG: DUF1634 domain-containing protein [Thermoflavifilum sp.]
MKRINDQRIEIFLSYLLRWGVTLSATVVAVSGFLFLLYHAGDTPHFHTFRGEHADLTSLQGILHAMLQGNIKAFIQFGIVLLIATPVARVFFSIIGFILEKDVLYIVLTLIVLGILMIGIFSGLGG